MAEIFLMNIKESERLSEEYCKLHFPKRFERSLKYRFLEDKLRCKGVGALLYYALNIDEKDIKYTDKGKPYSDNRLEKFSIAHSGEWSVVAISENNIGVDIEKIGNSHFSVASRAFVSEEIAFLKKSPDKNFAFVWTLKEALGKAVGLGISLKFNSFNTLPLLNGGSINLSGQAYYGQTSAFEEYALSCVFENQSEDVSLKTVTASMLTDITLK